MPVVCRLILAVALVALVAAPFAEPCRAADEPAAPPPPLPPAVAPDAAAEPAAPRVRLPSPKVRPPAPAFPAEFTWLGVDQPLALDGNLKGHVVLLDFWTYCCINCIHILPDLHYLETKYADQPFVVIGVHSAKFDTESDPKNIAQAMARYRIEHPVLVDRKHTVWQDYDAVPGITVNAWPTFVVIDTTGKIVGTASSEGRRELLDDVVGQLIEEGRKNGTLADKPLKVARKPVQPGPEGLAFPGKVAVDPAGKRLAVADSNHDRVLVTDLEGKVLHVIGSGTRGFTDGSFDDATLANPQGMAFDGDKLYIADLDNHAIRVADLAARSVTTLAGDGRRSYDRVGGGKGPDQGLASPWDLLVHDGTLYIAMAGTHQLWRLDLASGVAAAFAGSGREDLRDGDAASASLAQPSGLALVGKHLYFADSEVSAVRRVNLDTGEVQTLIGKGLFEFGFADGPFADAKLQHCLAVAAVDENTVLVADTYNSALRRLDLTKGTITTLFGGPDKDALDEPAGLAFAGGFAYIADTNHHRILRYDMKTGQATPLDIKVPVAPR